MTDDTTPRISRDEIEAKYGSAGDRTTRNPYLTSILVIWVVALIIGAVLLITGMNEPDLLRVIAGNGFLSLAIMGAMIHLAVKALLWKNARPSHG